MRLCYKDLHLLKMQVSIYLLSSISQPMKFRLIITFSLLSMIFSSCEQKSKYGEPVAEPAAVVKNIMSFLQYRDKNIRLYESFVGLDAASNIISKESFLKLLSTGSYLPMKMTSGDSTVYYKLYKLNNSIDSDITTTIRYWGLQEYDYYKLEGVEFPDFKFVDMDGNIYDRESTKGKIVVIKCWFLACLPCIKEMPVLNELRQKYLAQKDVLFISLCWDPKNKVNSFLKKNTFNYSTVPDQYKFLTEGLSLNGYPTHFVLNKDGKIFKKTQDYREMMYALKKLSLE
jgi:thiol-disulfide isomerase/thioredoxin